MTEKDRSQVVQSGFFHFWNFLWPVAVTVIPKKAKKPEPDRTFKPYTYYLEEFPIFFDTAVERWTAKETGERVPDEFFSGPTWIQGNESALPKELRTPKATVKDEKKGSFRAPSESESESESDNSQNPDDPFNDSSDLPAEEESATVPELSPLNELGLSATTEPNLETELDYFSEEETGKPDSSNSSSSPSTPSTHYSEMATTSTGPTPPAPPAAPTVHTPSVLR